MDQWFLTDRCVHCNAPLYERHYPTGNSWVPTGDHVWQDGGESDCQHETAEAMRIHEIHTSPNN